MTLVVPLTGSMVAGPLGLAHLPRLWQKALLKTVGCLPADYKSGTGGFDTAVTKGVGIDLQALVNFLRVIPTYEETEAWVRANATNLGGVPETTEYLVQREMPADRAAAMRERCGITNAQFGRNAYLNNIDDLATLHEYLIASRDAVPSPIVPAVSSFAKGPLGLVHLPRMWTKAAVKAAGALAESYHTDSEALDQRLAEAIRMDLRAAMRFISAALPSYMTFERWIRDHVGAIDLNAVARWNDTVQSVEATAHAVLRSDVLDWTLLHDEVVTTARGGLVRGG